MQETALQAAFEYAYPVFAVAQTRDKALHGDGTQAALSANTVRHERQLSDHRSRWITAPNNDTLYSNAWLDLSGGPVRIQVGHQREGRYWSLAFMDTFGNHIAVLGQHAPKGTTHVVLAPGLDVWLLCRWLVEGPHDLAQCHAMQDGLRILAPATAVPTQHPRASDSRAPTQFLDVVNHAPGRNPPTLRHRQPHAWPATQRRRLTGHRGAARAPGHGQRMRQLAALPAGPVPDRLAGLPAPRPAARVPRPHAQPAPAALQ